MTSALLLARDCIIYSVNVWLAPVECAFNMIESELMRRGSTFTRPNSPKVRATRTSMLDPDMNVIADLTSYPSIRRRVHD